MLREISTHLNKKNTPFSSVVILSNHSESILHSQAPTGIVLLPSLYHNRLLVNCRLKLYLSDLQ